MKKLTATFVATLALTGAAHAADLGGVPYRSLKDEPVYAPTFSWTGFYIGATAGYAWGDSRFNDGETSNPFDIDGGVFGGTIGYNLQFHRNWVAGIEADISNGPSGSFGPGNLGQPNGTGWGCGSGPCTTDVDWFGTLRGRLGFSADRLLVYATGGMAYGNINSRIENTTNFRADDTTVGWTVGGGVEYAFAPSWSFKVEYLHVDLGWTEKQGPLPFKSDAEFDVVRAGLNYRFGGR
jgi:outer membrane immunogenic protein